MDTPDLKSSSRRCRCPRETFTSTPFFSYRDPFDTEKQAWGRVSVRVSLTTVVGLLPATSARSPVSTLCLQVSLSTGRHTRTLVNTTQDLSAVRPPLGCLCLSVSVVFRPSALHVPLSKAFLPHCSSTVIFEERLHFFLLKHLFLRL